MVVLTRTIACLFAFCVLSGELMCSSSRAEDLDLDAAYEIMKGTRPVFAPVADPILQVPAPVPQASSAPVLPSPLAMTFDSLTLTPSSPAASSAPRSGPRNSLGVGIPTLIGAAAGTEAADGGTANDPNKPRVYGTLTGGGGVRFVMVRRGGELLLDDASGRPRIALQRQDNERFTYQILGTSPGDTRSEGTMHYEADLGGGRFTRYDSRGKVVESYGFSGSLAD